MHALSETESETESKISEASLSPDFSDENDDDEHTSVTSASQNLDAIITRALEIDARKLVEIVLYCFLRTNFVSFQKNVYENLSAELGIRLRLSGSEQQLKTLLLKECNRAIVSEPSTILRQHLACPFYLQDKEKHLGCLTRADLRGIPDLKEHLWTDHRQPSYCPTCHRTFTISENWGRHVRQRLCTFSDRPRPEGITALQMQILAQPVDPRISQHDQWLSVWDTTFPGTKAPMPVASEVETAVWALREFWAAEGDKILSALLAERQQQCSRLQNQGINVGKLGSQVLDLAVDQLVERFRQGRDTATTLQAGREPLPSEKVPRRPPFPI
ncbi:hypothetical protein F5Y08DRAFT_94441 [Xylaria arbuscula]|nr:hypothetical protein F5Y08DRAFT_94441 [Xylaria arbuscula]